MSFRRLPEVTAKALLDELLGLSCIDCQRGQCSLERKARERRITAELLTRLEEPFTKGNLEEIFRGDYRYKESKR
jgi:hypothetical protein